MTISATTIPAIIRPDRSLLDHIESRSNIVVSTCFQCQKCSAGCPMTFAMDYYPHQVIRMLQLGLRNELLCSRTIWVCTACETCVTRCPNEIDIPRLMDQLKQLALAESVPVPAEERTLPIIHQVFLDNIKKRGRIHELRLIGSYKFKTGKLLEDMRLGWEMFKRGKLKIIPPQKIRGIKAFQRLFEK